MARSRRLNVFSLSFLDVMSCGFGAVVLIFLIINHSTDDQIKEINRDLLSEIRILDYEIKNGQLNLVDFQQQIENVKRRVADARRLLMSALEDTQRKREDMDELEALSIARRESLEALQNDIETRQIEVRRLRAIEDNSAGNAPITIEGQGDRQYLTGLIIGGSHVLIAVDSSSSMLDETIVNVIRRRNMSLERKLDAPKWKRAISTVEWLAAQIPIESEFQIVKFNTQVETMLETDEWHEVADADSISTAIEKLSQTAPEGGTSLENLFVSIASMNPLPDNVILITDSLPTQGTSAPRKPTITGRQRAQLFNDAVKRLPRQIPVNIIMFPMEGDPHASALYWRLAQITDGAYMSPSKDWP
jgi:hypothetical protein